MTNIEVKEPKKRGLGSASPETRRRVASLGGKASHGGGRKKGSTSIEAYVAKHG